MVGLGGARLRFKLKGRNLEAFTKIRIVKNWLVEPKKYFGLSNL